MPLSYKAVWGVICFRIVGDVMYESPLLRSYVWKRRMKSKQTKGDFSKLTNSYSNIAVHYNVS